MPPSRWRECGDRPLLLLKVRRLPVLDNLIIAYGKLVAHVEIRAQQRLVVEPSEHEVVS